MAIRAELHLGIRDFQGNLKRATADVRKESDVMKRDSAGVGASLASGIKAALPAISFAALGAGIKGALQRADDLADMKIALGETAETLQRVDYAAQQAASVGVEELSKSMLKLEKNLGQVDNKAAADALANFGLTAGQLAGMSLDEKILALSGAFQAARADGTGVADIMDLLGRSGASLIPMLAQSKEALEAMFADAPVVADELIDRMAVLNDQFDGLVMKAKSSGIGIVGALGEVGTFLADLVSTGSLEEAFLNFDDRQIEALKNIASQSDAKETQATALDAQAAAAEAAKEEAAAADDLAKALERVAKIKDQIAAKEMASMSNTEQIAELERRRAELLAGSIANFPNFEASAEGLRALAESRDNTPGLPGEGMNSAAEAWEWYREALELSEKQRILETSLAKEEADAAKKRADELAAARAEAVKGGFALMTDEEQVADLKSRLGKALGIDVSSTGSIDGAIARQRKEVEDARASGDTAAEKAALDRLNESQRLAAEFYSAADGLAPAAPGGGVGSVAGLINQVFGRDPAAQQLDELKRVGDLARDQRDRLDGIIIRMDSPPEPVTFGGF
jgi:hypothetical protein